MQIPFNELDPIPAPRLYARKSHRDRIRVFVDAQTRSRISALVQRCATICGVRPSLSTLVRAGLIELEACIRQQADDPDTLRRKLTEAARGGC